MSLRAKNLRLLEKRTDNNHFWRLYIYIAIYTPKIWTADNS